MNLLLRATILLFFCGISLNGYTQLIKNPSFEGTPTESVAPSPWTPCNNFSTPDTQPGSWNVGTAPSNGKAYLGLVTRGDLGPFANNNEDAQVQLSSKLTVGQAYEFGIDLAFSDTQGHEIGWGDFLSYANPVILKVWGGVNGCAKTELLWESPAINHTDWKTYDFTITPTQQINYLTLEANYVALPSYFGNILIDNIIEKNVTDPINSHCNLEAFDTFTPNGDGKNDIFLFNPISNIARFNLKIYNRWGNIVYETSDIAQGWDGKINGNECTTGAYFWYTEYMCIDNNQIFDNKMKGYVTLLK